jgi:hypothetical protein
MQTSGSSHNQQQQQHHHAQLILRHNVLQLQQVNVQPPHLQLQPKTTVPRAQLQRMRQLNSLSARHQLLLMLLLLRVGQARLVVAVDRHLQRLHAAA